MQRTVKEKGSIPGAALAAGVFFSLVSVFGFLVLPDSLEPVADMFIAPASGTFKTGEIFTIDVVVSASVPVNVFSGELRFNNDVLVVDSIDYNTSVADLWAELPWYSNGEGTLNFGGGTTRPGGFTGSETLITVSFRATGEGSGMLSINNARILLHDGLGTDATLNEPVDALFFVENTVADPDNYISRSSAGSDLTIVKNPPTTDLNGDGKQSIADVSIFLLNIAGSDVRYDFNLDGKVGIKDLSIIMDAK